MSQVVVTKDSLQDKRSRSLNEEQQIDRNSAFQHWRKSDITTKKNPAMKLLGIAALPLVVFWVLLLAMMGAALWVFTLMLKGCGWLYKLIRG